VQNQPRPSEEIAVVPQTPREDWLRDSVLSGFVATFAMTVVAAIAYAFARSVGDANGGTFTHWLAGLTENRLTERTQDALVVALAVNLVMGLVWAIIYGRFFERIIPGPPVRRGLIFSLIPWILSLVIFFPLADVGFFGSKLGAGPLPTIGNLILHLVYGAVLGTMFAVEEFSGIGDTADEHRNAARAERGAVVGIIGGGVIGLVVGLLISPTLSDLANRPAVAIAGAFAGAAIGILVGSLAGMTEQREPIGER
jgi:hypothetical protein